MTARRWFPFAIAALVFALDRATKWWIENSVSALDTLVIIPGIFNIVHAQNRGAAFGILSDSHEAWRNLVLVGVSCGVMLYVASLLWQPARAGFGPGRTPVIALSLVLGGALGNLYDRIVRGSVTDFLQVFIGSYEWPSFNVADTAISIGAGLLILTLWRGRHDAVRT